MPLVHFVSPADLDAALSVVQDELIANGLWERVNRTEVFWCRLPQWPPRAMGFFIHAPHPWIPRLAARLGYHVGHIYIPGPFVARRNLRDVLRHEYAHALAHYRPSVHRAKAFTKAFGAGYWHATPTVAQAERRDCVSAYAQTRPMEDFAETFMLYLRRGGRLPRRLTARIRRKWAFIAHLNGG